MRAISIHQPWALWVATGWKKIETRTHNRFSGLVGERVAIHAAQAWDELALEIARPYLSKMQINLMQLWNRADGQIIATAYVKDARLLKDSDSLQALCPAKGLFGLILSDVSVLQRFIPWKGQQGIFKIPTT